MTEAHQAVEGYPAEDAWTAPYGVLRVLREQPSGATLFVCESQATGAYVVVKQHTKTDEDIGHEPIDAVAAVEDTASAGSLVLVTRSRDSFTQELHVARILTTHPHQNVVQCLPSPPAFANDTLVMEYCPRGDLLSLLGDRPDQCLTETEALDLFRGIVDGVAHLHSLDIAHRDLSLENVLVNAEGRPKVCDFGLSTTASVLARECVGKLQYMAPEVARGAQSYEPILADVWSLGILLFIMLTGSPLFDFAVPSDRAWRAVETVGIAGILRSWGMLDCVSDETVALLSDMLRTDPAQRCQSLDHVRSRLPAVD